MSDGDMAAPAVEQDQAPAPMLAGTFALYPDGKGGFVLVTETTEHGVQRKHIPSAVVKLATGGIIGRKLGDIFGG